jgi:hypothetical protein
LSVPVLYGSTPGATEARGAAMPSG